MSGVALIFAKGLFLSLGLIVALGPQNVYVLRKGLMRRHVIAVASACFLVDAVLLVIGGLGVGGLITTNAQLATMTAWSGAAFLGGLGLWNFRAALNPGTISRADIDAVGKGAQGKGVVAATLMALALSLLNPHLYFDTLIVIASVAGQYQYDVQADGHIWGSPRMVFTLGAIAGSAIWFYGLGFGAARLAPWFRTDRAWRMVDVASGTVMLVVAVMLILGELGAH